MAAAKAALFLGLVCCGAGALAQSREPGGMPPPSGMSLAQSAAMRFPQPVRVGDLVNRNVLEPVVTQRLLGTVADVVRAADGTVNLIVRYGGVFGFGSRLIAVPVDASVLLGVDVEVVAFTPDQLSGLPTFVKDQGTPLPRDSFIKVGLAKPSH